MADPASIQTLKSYIKAAPTSKELGDAFLAAYMDNDRATAIVSASLVDVALSKLLLCAFPGIETIGKGALFQNNGPVQNFSNKIKFGAAFGFYGEKRMADLDCVREVRNAFAHSPIDLKFTQSEAKNVVNRIVFFTDAISSLGKTAALLDGLNFLQTTMSDDPKNRFWFNCFMIGSMLDQLSEYKIEGIYKLLQTPNYSFFFNK